MLESGGDPSGVGGLVHRREDGQPVANPASPPVADLDELPLPAYDLIPEVGVYRPPPFHYRRRPVANIITSRGCPNRCTFCASAAFAHRLRLRSAESVVAEIELLIRRFGVREIAFSDDCFTADTERVRRIFDLAASRGLRFQWSAAAELTLSMSRFSGT